MKIKYKHIARSLTGFSIPVFGVSWNPPVTDRQIARELIAFLEDRRVLYNPFELENPRYVVESVLEIRRVLTEMLQRLEDDSDIGSHLRAIRAACRKFLNQVDNRFTVFDLPTAIGELRAIFGIHIAQLSVKYGIDIEEELASVLPIEDNEASKPNMKR